MDRISPVKQPVFKGAVRRLARRFEDRAVDAEQPAMVTAADPCVADQPELQRRTAMRTMQFQQPRDAAAAVAKRHQILAEDPHPIWQVAQLVGEADRLPEAPQIFAAQRAGADMSEFRVFRWNIAV